MKNFKEWLNLENQTPNFKGMFDGIAGGFDQAKAKKNDEYARRIIAGEDPKQVMQGIVPNGAMWTAVMNRVQELQGKTTMKPQSQPVVPTKPLSVPVNKPIIPQATVPPVSNQTPQNQISVSGLEQKFGLRPKSLDLQVSKDQKYVFVRNRLNGKALNSGMNPAEVEATVKKLFGLL